VLAAVTGRTAYGSPPLQQFPPRTRRMVVFDRPAVSLDWSAIEPITLALLARETGMIDTYEAGGDLYQYVASAAGVIRPTAKKVFLGSLYGLGVLGLAGQLGVPSAEAEEIRKKVFAPIPAVETARRMLNGMARTYGNVVTVSGRPIPTFSAYAGTNYAVQGSAYDLLAVVLAELYRRGMADEIYLAVHDEIVASREVATEVDRLMRTPPPELIEAAGRVPVLRTGWVDLGRNWTAKE